MTSVTLNEAHSRRFQNFVIADLNMAYGGGGNKVTGMMAETLQSFGGQIDLVSGRKFNYKAFTYDMGASLDPAKIRSWYPSHGFILPFPMDHFQFALWTRKIIRLLDPEVVVLYNDFPRMLESTLRKRRSLVYIHFPIATRWKLGIPEGQVGLLPFRPMRRLFSSRVLCFDHFPADVAVVNSSITARYAKLTWKGLKPKIIYPPIKVNDYFSTVETPRQNAIVVLGDIQETKAAHVVVEAVSKLSVPYRLYIIGRRAEPRYLAFLVDTIRRHRVRASIIRNASYSDVCRILKQAKAIAHVQHFEPFGIAVTEGMAAGCVPIVWKDQDSGPWVDIIQKGHFGLGFQSTKELTDEIASVLSDDKSFRVMSRKAMLRAHDFDISNFHREFKAVID